MSMQATVLVCDDARLEISGKALLIGVYLDDIAIPSNDYVVQRLCFFLTYEGDFNTMPHSAKFELALPNQTPVQWDLPMTMPPRTTWQPRTKFVYRYPFSIFNRPLNAGRITCRVLHPLGEVQIAGPWITIVPPPPEIGRNHPVAYG